ncbi:MAG: hypothetical protein JNK66_09170 [Chitinophagales bacterium]|nr:hypothetical protein [Chitinophagales bacterium]
MSNNSKYNKTDFIRLTIATAEHVSSDKETAKEYLSSEGLDVDSVVNEGMKRLKRLKMQIEADRTKSEMIHADKAKQKASAWVEELLSKIDFSLPELIKEEELTMSFRNVEKLSKEDIKNILIKHFTLKFLDEESKKSK